MSDLERKKLNITALEKRVMLDASLGALTTTTVIAENDANASPQTLDNDVTITGTTTDFNGDALTVSTTSGIEDQLTISHEGTGAGEIGFDGSNVTYEGTLIGTLSSNGTNGNDLTIDLNANATKVAIENLIENVTYQNSSDNPTVNRTINFSLAAYFSEDISVTIVAQNETPNIDINTPLTIIEGGTDIITPAMLGVSDPDNVDTDVVFTITSAVSYGRLELTTNTGVAITSFTLDDLNNNRVQYVHDAGEAPSDSFDFTITDGVDSVGTQTFNINVTPVDDAPTIITNNGADVSLGFSVSLGGEAPTFGTEVFRESGVGSFSSRQTAIDGQNRMFTLVFTTDSSNHTGNPGQVLFEDGGSGRGIGLYLNSANELVWYSGAAANSPEITSSGPLLNSTQYAVVIEVDTNNNQLRMHYDDAGNFDWFSFGRTPEAQLSGYTDHGDLSGGDDGAIGVAGGSSRGGYNGSVNGTQTFQGSIDSDLVVYDFPSGGTTPNTSLVTTDVDDSAGDLIYTITSDVSFGTIYKDGVAIGLNDTFTQNDLNIGLVIYDSVIGNDDQFEFSLYDGTTTISSQTFDIRVNTVNTAPTILSETVIYNEDFEGGTSGWNNNTTTVNGTLSEFWGRFNRNINVSGNQELFQTFSLSGSQEYVTVEFDFYEIDSWDNEYFYVFIDDQQILNNHRLHQNTYDQEANGSALGGDVTYRVQELTDGLGWIEFSNSYRDQNMTYSITIKTTDTDFKLGFGTSLNSTNFNDESFGIDNLRITELGTAGTDRTLQISELTPNNDQVGFVQASDPDIGQSLTYSLTGGTGAGIFSVNNSTGEIRVSDNSTIDFESGITSYTLTVRATDNGPGLLFDEQTYTINILDALENTAPTFTGTGPFSIAENAAVNDDVGTVTTNDAEGDNVSYRIISGNGDGIFKINSTTGLIEIRDTTNLDFDKDNQYTIRIRATDDNDLFKYRDQNVTINITDIDEAPLLNAEDVIETQNAGVFYSSATGNFYKLITANKSFNDALNFAPTEMLNGVAGHGLTIMSAAEFSFIDSITPTHNWLALTDQDSEGNWYWVAGPEAGTQIVRDGNVRHPGFFNNWNSGEPNSGNSRDYALMHSNDRWYDNWTSSYDSVVEWEGGDIINNDTYLVNHTNPDASDVVNGQSIGFIQGLDPEGGALDYTIQAGNIDGIFEIDLTTGELRILDTTNLDATITDSYTLTIRATEQIGGKFVEIDVTINFNDDFTISTNNVLTVAQGSTTMISTSELNISDIDNVATDTIFRVESKPTHGRIELSTYPGFEISNFTFDDLQNNRVVYVHDASENFTDSFDFSVTDGGNIISGTTFDINITDVNFGPSIDTNTGATVIEGSNVLITQTMLDSSDPDAADTPDQLTYTISGLSNGHVEVNGTIQTTFTQDDINNNLVVFVHDGSEGNGSFNVSLADGGENGSTPATGTFIIAKTDVNDAPVITTNNIIDVVEGQTVTITTADLLITDPDDSGTGLIYTLSGITNGFVELSTNVGVPIISFTQDDLDNNRVVFRHDGNEGDAQFDISVADGGENGSTPATATVFLNKIDVNDAPTIPVNTGSSINQNSILILNSFVLRAADSDDAPSGITFTVNSTTNGQVELVSNPNVAITSFTQDDINNSRVLFRHSGPPTTATFVFDVADGGENGATPVTNQTFTLNVDNTNDAPVISNNTPPTMNEGTVLTLTTAMLDSFDPDDFGADLTWTASNYSNGTLRVNGVVQSTFTQADLAAGLITFEHDGSETTLAGFDVQVADGGEDGATADTGRFNINVTPINEGPAIIVNDGNPNLIDFNTTPVNAYDGFQDGQGGDPTSAVASGDGTTLTLGGNAWKKIDVAYTLTANTILSFEFKADTIQEIQGIGFDNNTDYVDGVFGYQLAGTQTWSGMNQSFSTYEAGDGWVRFDIPVGGDYTGAIQNLVFVQDNDDGNHANTSNFRNVGFYESNQILSVNEGGTFNITNAHINSVDPDDGVADLTFTALNVKNGHIEVGGVMQNTFTQDDINNNQVVFIHDGTNTLSAGFELSLADGGENGTTPANDTFNLIVTPVNDAPIAVANNGLSLNEGATQTITAADITITDSDTEPRNVVFTATALPSNGQIELSTNSGTAISSFSLADLQNNLVRYIHDGSETTTDSFTFIVSDGSTDLPADIFNISITPQNDSAIIAGDLFLSVNEGASVTLTTTDLNMVDPDDGASDVTYTASNLSNGHIEVGGVMQNTFTQDDILNGDVDFIHDGSETTTAGFDISLMDGLEHGAVADTDSVSISVTSVNDAPTAILLSNTDILDGMPAGTVIGSLSSNDSDLPGDNFTYSLISDPDSKFIVSGNNLILNDALDYGTSASHSVTIRTDDGNGGTFDRIFTINVIQNVAPTELHLDNSSVEENADVGKWIGNLTATDPNAPDDLMTYTLMSNPDNVFMIFGNQLLVRSSAIDFEITPTVDIMVRVEDMVGNSFDQAFTIDIQDLAESSGDGFIEPELLKRDLNTEFFSLKNMRSELNSILQSTLSGQGNALIGDLDQILKTNTTEQIREFLAIEQSIVLPVGAIDQSQANFSEDTNIQNFDNGSDYTNIREAIAFLKDIEQTQDKSATEQTALDLYDVNQEFVDVLTYHEQRQQKLLDALSD